MLLPAVISISVFGLQILIKIIYNFLQPRLKKKNFQKVSNQGNSEDVKKSDSSLQIDSHLQHENQQIKNDCSELKDNQCSIFIAQDSKRLQSTIETNINNNEDGKKLKGKNQKHQVDQEIQIQTQNQQQQQTKQINYNLELFTTSLVFIQALVSRVYIKKTNQIIEFPQILYLSLISACINSLYYNLFYGQMLQLYKKQVQEITSLQIILTIYHLVIPFFIYYGLDHYIKFDFVTILIALIYCSIFQILLQKKVPLFSILPTKLEF